MGARMKLTALTGGLLLLGTGVASASSGGMPQLNVHDFTPQLAWLVITFTVLYLIVSRVALPRIVSLVDERAAKIAADLDAAQAAKRDAEAAGKAYEAALADARAKANAIAGETRAKLAAQSDQEKKAVEAKLATDLAAAADRIRARKDEAMANVRDVAAGAAGAIVTRLIAVTPDAAAISAAVNAQMKDS